MLVRCAASGYVGGAVAGFEDFGDGGLDGGGVLFEGGGVAKDHCGGEDCAERVGFAGAGDVGGGAVDGFVEVDLAADGGRGQHAEGAGDDAGFVGEDVAEEVFGEDDVEVSWRVHDVHGHGVDELVFESDAGIVLGDFGDGGAP